MLGVILACYRDLDEKVRLASDPKIRKTERVEKILRRRLGKVMKAEIADACPGVSQVTIQRALTALVKEGRIEKAGAAALRYTPLPSNDGTGQQS